MRQLDTRDSLVGIFLGGLINRILGDPGADSGDEGKSKRAEKCGPKTLLFFVPYIFFPSLPLSAPGSPRMDMPMLEETAYISLRIKTFRNCTCSVTANSVSLLISSLNWFASLNAKKRGKKSRSNKLNTEDIRRLVNSDANSIWSCMYLGS